MHDNWLIAIAMSIAGLGITMLLFALILIEPEQSTIDATALAQDNTPAHIKGTVQSIRLIGNKTLVTVSQPSKIDIIIEDTVLNITKNSCIDITGKKSSYNNKAQVIASKIKEC